MKMKTCLVAALAMAATSASYAMPITTQYNVTVNTSSISGTLRSLFFALTPGLGAADPVTATITGFGPKAGIGGNEGTTGDAGDVNVVNSPNPLTSLTLTNAGA